MAMLETAHGALYYEVIDLTPPWRTGPATMIFHHGVGTNADIWSDWLGPLAGRYRLVRFDSRGLGRSSRPGDGFAWSMTGMAADLLAIADAVDARRFHLVGESLGGTVALHVAAHHGDRLLSATGVSCSHKGASIRRVEEWRAFIAERGMAAWSAGMMAHRFHPGAISPALHAWFEAEQAASSPAVTLALAEMLIGTDLTADLPAIETPVLLLAPDGSPFVAPPITAEMHSLVPGAELEIFAHARHGLACSHGVACAECLYDFLTRRAEAAQRRLQCEEHTP